MKRYHPLPISSHQCDMPICEDGDFVLEEEAQSTIASLQAQLAEREATILEQQAKMNEVKDCFDAAFAEGLWDRLNEGGDSSDSSWYGLFTRRLVYAYNAVEYQNLSALEAARKAERIKTLEEAAKWFDDNHLMMLQKALMWSEELRRMANELKEQP